MISTIPLRGTSILMRLSLILPSDIVLPIQSRVRKDFPLAPLNMSDGCLEAFTAMTSEYAPQSIKGSV